MDKNFKLTSIDVSIKNILVNIPRSYSQISQTLCGSLLCHKGTSPSIAADGWMSDNQKQFFKMLTL